MIKVLIFAGLLIGSLIPAQADSYPDEVEDESKNKKFDFLVFAQIWPVTSCDIWEAKSESNTCFLPQEDRWTVHGIWPSVNKGPLGPFNCNNSIHFDPKSLEPIMDKLNIQWTDVHKNAQKDDFWKHEWTKHGTCAIQLEAINTELKYFSKGLEWNDQYDIVSILSKSQIVPGKGYTGKEIADHLMQTLGKRPAIDCVKNEKFVGDDSEGKLLFSEVRICIDKSFNVIDCNSKLFGQCSQSEPVNFYPKMPHKRMKQLEASATMVGGIIAVIFIMIIAAICLFICYKRNATRHRGYENI